MKIIYKETFIDRVSDLLIDEQKKQAKDISHKIDYILISEKDALQAYEETEMKIFPFKVFIQPSREEKIQKVHNSHCLGIRLKVEGYE